MGLELWMLYGDAPNAYSTYSQLYSWAGSICFVVNTERLLRKRLKGNLFYVRKES